MALFFRGKIIMISHLLLVFKWFKLVVRRESCTIEGSSLNTSF